MSDMPGSLYRDTASFVVMIQYSITIHPIFIMLCGQLINLHVVLAIKHWSIALQENKLEQCVKQVN